MPAWAFIDPLPIVAFGRDENDIDPDDDKIEAMIDEAV